MSAKHVLLVALVLVNLLLVTALVLHLTAPRPAQAQVIGGGAAYAMYTAKLLQGNEDALWVLDLKSRKLTVFRLPPSGKMVMTLMDTKDLQREMRGGEKPK